jgi:hypothetical protein
VDRSYLDDPSQDLSVVPATPRPLPAIPYHTDERDPTDGFAGHRSKDTDRCPDWVRQQSSYNASTDVDQMEPVTHRFVEDAKHTSGPSTDWALELTRPTAEVIHVTREPDDGSDSSSSSAEIVDDDWPQPNQGEDPCHSPGPSRAELLQENHGLKDQLESYRLRESLHDEDLRDSQKRCSELEDTLRTLQKERSEEASLLASTKTALSEVRKDRDSLWTECDELKRSNRRTESDLEFLKRRFVEATGSAVSHRAKADALERSVRDLGDTMREIGEDLAENQLVKMGLGRLRRQARTGSYERRSKGSNVENTTYPLSMPSIAKAALRN